MLLQGPEHVFCELNLPCSYNHSVKWSQTPFIWLTREETWGEDDVPHPVMAIDLCVKAARDVPWHTAGQSIQDDSCWVDGTVAVHIEHSQQCHDDDPYRNEETLRWSYSCIWGLYIWSVCVCHYQVSHILWCSIQKLLLWVGGSQKTTLLSFRTE